MPCTIVSMSPFPTERYIPGLLPCTFEIPAAKVGEFVTLVIKNVQATIDHGPRTIFAPEPDEKIANSIVKDTCSNQLGVSSTSGPGMFVIPGEPDHNTIQKMYKPQLAEAQQRQANWFKELYTMAEDMWSRNPKLSSITGPQRYAAMALGLKPRWLVEPTAYTTAPCVFCTVEVKTDALVCPNCRNILKPEEFKKTQADLATVKVG
jgi:hypothetical protein